MDLLSAIKRPIIDEMAQYRKVFESSFRYDNALLQMVLDQVLSRSGKMMRPMLTILSAKLHGEVNLNTLYSAATFECFHTASLVHDDVVDESDERRGQSSVNDAFGNKIAVLSGDFILSMSLYNASMTGNPELVKLFSQSAQRLASGELLQLSNVSNQMLSEEVYYRIISDKTAALFSACAQAGVMSVTDDVDAIRVMREFGEKVGVIFQIRDDIFDYMSDESIGKPVGNDMKEGKLTLPVISVLLKTQDEQMMSIATKVKNGEATAEEVSLLVQYTIDNGGITYAQQRMTELADEAKALLEGYPESDVKSALYAYVDYVVGRSI